MNTRESLGDTAARFPILPARLADALDEHGADAMAWVWIVDGKLVNLELIPAPEPLADWELALMVPTVPGARPRIYGEEDLDALAFEDAMMPTGAELKAWGEDK